MGSPKALRRHKLHIVRHATGGMAHSFRCSSSPQKVYDFPGTPLGSAVAAATSADQSENVCDFSYGQPACTNLFCVNILLQPVSTDPFSKSPWTSKQPKQEGMCCFDNERFTLFCCVHTYQQWVLLDLSPFLRNVIRYVRTRRISVKPIYMRSCNGFHSHESPHPPSG